MSDGRTRGSDRLAEPSSACERGRRRRGAASSADSAAASASAAAAANGSAAAASEAGVSSVAAGCTAGCTIGCVSALASASLAAVCPCLADDGYHPAALQNAWDVQRLLNLVLAAPPAEPPTRIRLRAPGFRACCCAPPAPNRTNGNIAHWARVCVPDD